MRLLQRLNPEHVSNVVVLKYPIREAVRAVVTDQEGRVALLHVTRDHYYKLPGGGIEKNEERSEALQRECLEEIGSAIEIVGEIGPIIEYRKFARLQQVSYCYFAHLRGEKGTPHFMEDEIAEGFEPLWVSYPQAIDYLSMNEATTLEGRSYIVPRDLTFLKAAKKYIIKEQ